MDSSHTQEVLRQRGIAIGAGGLALQLLIALGLLYASPLGLLALLPLLGTAGALAASYSTLRNRIDLAMRLQAATVIGGVICIFRLFGRFGSKWTSWSLLIGGVHNDLPVARPTLFVMLLMGAAVTYFGGKQLAAGLGH